MAMSNPGILAIWNDCAPGTEAEYERWYRTEHLAERVGVEGFVSGWRYVAVDGSPRYFTHYVTESVDVLFSPAYEERMNNPTPLTQQIMAGVFRDCTRTICERALRIGDQRGGYAVVVRFVAAQDERKLSDAVRRVAGQKNVLRGELWIASKKSVQTSFAEVEIRGPDDVIGACVVIEYAVEDDARELMRTIRSDVQGADEIGIYRLMVTLQRDDQHS